MSYSINQHSISLLKYLPPPVVKFIRSKYYRTELALINKKHNNINTHPSIIHFSVNKAATQYVKSILRHCATQNGMVPVGLNEYAFNSDFPFLDHLSAQEMKKYQHIFKNEGYLYSAFGGMIEGIQNLEKYKIVFLTRDPRDVLVSQYFSISYSHPVPHKMGDKLDSFMIHRAEAINSTIDDYVISESSKVFDVFSRYQTLLIDKYKDLYITTYEQMVIDFEAWLTDLVNYCELNISIQPLLKEHDAMKPSTENIYKHVRKGQPGDYKKKLKPETIQYLNNKFEPILIKYNYSAT